LKTVAQSDLFRKLPSADEVVRSPALALSVATEGHAVVTDAVRAVLAGLRHEIAMGRLGEAEVDLALAGFDAAVERQLRQSLAYSLRPVINATGVILHTNLGRAPLLDAAIDQIRRTAATYSNLEFDLESGQRGKRDIHLDHLFQRLLAESMARESKADAKDETKSDPSTAESSAITTIVVNNNAAAVLLALNTLAEGSEVIVSRGELVEIGGSFRIPDVMGKSGAILREVGTTNRTRIADYERAINDRTGLLLRVHRSNFEISGFTERPLLAELTGLARTRGLPLMEDLGSGALFDLRSIGIAGEPGILDSLRSGVDLVTYSGDKLLGGPQAGLISGRRDLVARMRGNCLFRALRADKLIYAALEATLLAYVKRDHDAIPALRMMRLSKEDIGRRAEALVAKLISGGLEVELIDGESVIGGGAAPSSVLPTRLLALFRKNMSADEIATRLRAYDPPIVARVEEDRVLLDLRTVFESQDEAVLKALKALAEMN
jgi:L-seryl-tRNA(Ser) seleniumtransferase